MVVATLFGFTLIYTIQFSDSNHWNGMDDNITDLRTEEVQKQKFINRFYFAATTTSTVGLVDIVTGVWNQSSPIQHHMMFP